MTNLNGALSNGTINDVDGTLNIGVSQTLASLTIGAGGVVTLAASAPGALPEFAALPDGAAFGVESGELGAAPVGSVQAVPEPGALSLLAAGVLGLFGGRRRRAVTQ